MFKHAQSPTGYKDVALLLMLWNLLGHSSDAVTLVKQQLSVYPGQFSFLAL